MSHAVELSTEPLKHEKDTRIWCLSTSGDFSSASARKILQDSAQVNPNFQKLWCRAVPNIIGFFLCLFRILPTDDSVQKVGVSICSRCSCCANPSEGTLDHVMLHGELAAAVWKKYVPFSYFLKVMPSRGTLVYGFF